MRAFPRLAERLAQVHVAFLRLGDSALAASRAIDEFVRAWRRVEVPMYWTAIEAMNPRKRYKDITAECGPEFTPQDAAQRKILFHCRVIGVHPDGTREDITDLNYWVSLNLKITRCYIRDPKTGNLKLRRRTPPILEFVERRWADVRILLEVDR